MKFSGLVNRIGGEAVDAWRIHSTALDAAERGEDVIVLSVGDPDFATPAPIVEAAVAALQAGDTHYTTVVGRHALRQAIADQHNRRSGQSVTTDQVVVTAGTQNALYSTTQCICQAGDEVVVPEPMYLTYQATVGASGATLVPVGVDVDNNFQIDVRALAAAITPSTKAIYIATPCNPTGTVMDKATLQGVAQLAMQHDLWVVSDEVYADLTFEPTHLSISSLPGMAERTVTVSSLSKSYAMAGWRLGWAIGPEPLIGHMANLQLCSLYGLPGFIQQGAIAALDRHVEVTQAMRQAYWQRRDIAYALLSQVPGLQCHLPQAGMFMMVDIRQTGLSAEEFCWGLYHHTGVSVLDAEAFGPAVRGFVRLGFVVNPERLKEACQRIASFVETLATHGMALSVQEIQALHKGNRNALA